MALWQKWLATCALSSCFLTGARGAIPTLVQHSSNSSDQGNPITIYTMRLPNTALQGNCIIVGFQYASSAVIPTVTDDKGNAYFIAAKHDDGNQVVNLAVALNVLAGAQKITISFSGGAATFVSGLASEFYDIAPSNALDGSSGSSGSSSNVTAGSLTPSSNGDLIYQYAVQDSTSNPMTSWTQGNSWALLSADVLDGSAAQYQVQSSAAAVNPTLGMSPSQNFNSIAVALKSASAGSPPSSGIRVIRVQHNSVPPGAASPVRLQFPCTGNLIIVSWIGVQNHDLANISDGNGNSYTSTGPPFGLNQSGDNQMYYAASALTGTDIVGPVLSTVGTDISGSTAILFDVVGAAASPFDAAAGLATASGVQLVSGPVTAASITPSTANGLIISSIGVTSNTVNGVSPGNFLSAVPAPVLSPNHTDQNNGWALNYNANTSKETLVWATQDGPVDNWASIAAAFQAANVLAGPDFTLSVSPTSQTIGTTGQASYTLTLQSVNGFSNTVQLTCSGLPPGATCSLDGASVGAGSSSLVIQTQNAAAGTYVLNLTGTNGTLTHSAQSDLIVSSGSFSGSLSPKTATVAVGGSQSFTLQVDSNNGFQGPVALSCQNPPAGVSCQFSPSPVTVNSNSTATSTLTVNVSAKPGAVVLVPPFIVPTSLVQPLVKFLVILFFVLLACWRYPIKCRTRLQHGLLIAVLFLLVSGLASCGGGASTPGSSGAGSAVTIRLAIQGTSGNATITLDSVAITIP